MGRGCLLGELVLIPQDGERGRLVQTLEIKNAAVGPDAADGGCPRCCAASFLRLPSGPLASVARCSTSRNVMLSNARRRLLRGGDRRGALHGVSRKRSKAGFNAAACRRLVVTTTSNSPGMTNTTNRWWAGRQRLRAPLWPFRQASGVIIRVYDEAVVVGGFRLRRRASSSQVAGFSLERSAGPRRRRQKAPVGCSKFAERDLKEYLRLSCVWGRLRCAAWDHQKLTDCGVLGFLGRRSAATCTSPMSLQVRAAVSHALAPPGWRFTVGARSSADAAATVFCA